MGATIKIKSANGDIISYYTESLSNTYSISNIKYEINKEITKPRFRVSLLNEDETVKTVFPQEDIIEGGSYSENYQSGQRRTVSLTLNNTTGAYTPSINGLWANSKMSFDIGFELIDGGILWFPKGIYSLMNISTTYEPGIKTVSLELGDKWSTLEGLEGTLDNTYIINTGLLIEDIIKDILTMQKGNGEMLDTKSIVYNSSFKGKTTQITITKSAGDTYASIILDLATMLSAEVFYDVEGHLTFVPIDDVSDDVDKPIIYDFYDFNGDFGSDNLSFDLQEITNKIIVIGAKINGKICEATAVNDDPTSPLSYQRIGYRTASPITDTAITSSILAEERAEYELRQKLVLKSSVSHSIRFNPLLTVNNLISVTDDFYGFKEEKFLLQSISCPIDYSGTMSITCSNIRNLPFVVGL